MKSPIPRPALQNTIIGFKAESPDAIVIDDPEATPDAPAVEYVGPEPRLTDSPAFVLLVWTLIGLVVGVAWTL